MQPERVGFLACGWSLARPDAHGTAIALQDGNQTVLIDAGGDAAKQLTRIDGLDSLERIYLTHEHPDHVWSLPGLLHCLRFADRDRPLPVAGPSPALERAQGAVDALGVTTPFDVQWRAIGMEPGEDDRARWVPLDHGVDTLGYRFGDVVVLGDTRPSDASVELAAGAEVLVHEASHTDEELCHGSGHSTPSDAGGIASRADVDVLALIHIHPTLEPTRACQEAGFARTIAPSDGDRLAKEGQTWTLEG